jgi:hypothetical protein
MGIRSLSPPCPEILQRIPLLSQERAAVERFIRAVKADDPFGQPPTNTFDACAFDAELSLFAYHRKIWSDGCVFRRGGSPAH